MPTAVSEAETSRTRKPTPDVKAIMADIRDRAQNQNNEDTVTKRQYRANVRDRLSRPLGRGFTEDFVQIMRVREPEGWNVQLEAESFGSSRSSLVRGLRWLFAPVRRALVNTDPAVRQAARQAEINEYFRRLLVAANEDLELTRLELGALRQQLGRLGVKADFSFAEPKPAPDRSRGRSPRGRSDSRRGRPREDSGGDRRDGSRSRSGRGRPSRGS